jgi:carbamoyltransferase
MSLYPVAFEETPFTNLFVQPAAHDAGTALGAAFFIWNHILDNEQHQPMTHAYLGPSFTDSEIEEELQTHQLTYRHTDQIEREVAELISQNNIVGFFQGRMEIGPRALGNRSLLADPRHPDMRGILNRKVKHREYFRPLAPSILYEEAKNWFHIKKETSAADFMLMAYPVKESVKDKIPAVVHVDGTSRIQAVKKETNPRYHKLISEFYHTGRKRFNVLGALNAVTKEIITINNDTYINAISFCQLLLKMAETVGHGPITIILDNARYQKCAIVWGYAQTLGI